MSAVIALAITACSDDDDTGNNTQQDATTNPQDAAPQLDGDVPQPDAETQPDGGVNGACDSLQAGPNNGFMVDGVSRSFMLNLPDNAETDGPFAVIFSYHGLGDTMSNFAGLFAGQVNNAEMPFVLVTPEDTNYQMYGMNADWDGYNIPDFETNVEVRLFDEVLACIDQRWGVDPNHVHATGFSIGGGVADLLGVARGDTMASIASYSGAYLDNQDNVSTLGMLAGQIHWDGPTHSNAYTQLFVHGGTNDVYDMMVTQLHFDVFAANDAAYLNGMGHDAIVCNHGSGHACPSSFSPAYMIRFFIDHPKGTTDSPYGTALPAEFPQYCEFQAGQ